MGFRRGVEHLKEAASRGGGFDKTRYFRWNTGESKILRMFFDMDEVFSVWFHEMVECSDGRSRSFVCRQEIGETCELCAVTSNGERARRREIGIGVAIQRVEHREAGNIVGYSDAVEEIEGKKVPIVGLVKMGPRNFWAKFEHFYARYGTVIDRDYEVTRIGSGTSTDYIVVPCDPVALPERQESWRTYLDVRYGDFVPNVEEMLMRYASQEYYDRFLRGQAQQGETGSPDDVETEQTVFERLRAERERLTAQ